MKSWSQKLDAGKSVVKIAPRRFGDIPEGAKMFIPTARQVDDFVRAIPAGRGMVVKAFRDELARNHGADGSCPVTTGIHLRTVAEAAYEAVQRGEPMEYVTPFWRVLDSTAPTVAKLACGVDFVATQRLREGLEP